jgi:hypothetical protein
MLKAKIKECSRKYIEHIEGLAHNASDNNLALSQEEGEQKQLNRTNEALDFE